MVFQFAVPRIVPKTKSSKLTKRRGGREKEYQFQLLTTHVVSIFGILVLLGVLQFSMAADRISYYLQLPTAVQIWDPYLE